VHVSLAELRAMDCGSVLQDEWITALHARWAAARATASVAGGDGAAWLEGDAARAVTCDASLIPVVTSQIDTTVLDDLVGPCVTLAGCGGCGQPAPAADQPGGPGQPGDPDGSTPAAHCPCDPPAQATDPARGGDGCGRPGKATDRARGGGACQAGLSR